MKERAERLQRIQQELGSTLFKITHKGSERIIAKHERRVAEIEALRAKDGSNAEEIDRLIAQSAAVREAQLSQLRAKEVEAAEKVRAANERVVASLQAEREALALTERERFVAQALSRLSAEATAQQRREFEQLAGTLFDEQALQARQRLMDEARSETAKREMTKVDVGRRRRARQRRIEVGARRLLRRSLGGHSDRPRSTPMRFLFDHEGSPDATTPSGSGPPIDGQ